MRARKGWLAPKTWVFGAVAAVLLAVSAPATSQVTQDEVQEALDARSEIERRLDAAVQNHEAVYSELEDVTYRIGDFRARIDDFQRQITTLEDQVADQAVEAYMGGSSTETSVFFQVESVTELLTRQELIEIAANSEIGLLDRVSAIRNSLDATRAQLEEDQNRIRELEQEQLELVNEINVLFAEADAAYQDVRGEFEEQEAQRRAEEQRRRLAALAQLQGAAAGAPASSTPGFICLFRDSYRFSNDWGNPRSGGRTHKGTDIVAPFGHPVIAVGDGVVSKRNSTLGGTSLWLDADYGTSYYYAHLSGYADGISNGTRVSKGQVIAYNGDSGNAKGGVPHVHFQIHPGGRGSAPVNPYPTLVNACP
jgi:murein DD-endopeptidase MepM/ murein hydrolase activator NlpD